MIKVGSRDSRLAVVQAEEVMRRLGECKLVTMKTTGDKILDRTLDKVGGKGLFVKELDRALAAGEVDLTVHSLKDVPMEQPDGLPLIAFPKRADARDALVLPEDGSWDREKPIGCSSARRRVQLAQLFPGIEVKPVRGNVQTRLRRLDSGEYGALVLAADCTVWDWKTASAGIFRRRKCSRRPGRASLPCRRGRASAARRRSCSMTRRRASALWRNGRSSGRSAAAAFPRRRRMPCSKTGCCACADCTSARMSGA